MLAARDPKRGLGYPRLQRVASSGESVRVGSGVGDVAGSSIKVELGFCAAKLAPGDRWRIVLQRWDWPSFPPPPFTHKVTTSFTLAGSVSDYGEAERASIKRMVATAARG